MHKYGSTLGNLTLNVFFRTDRSTLVAVVVTSLITLLGGAPSRAAGTEPTTNEICVAELQGTVETSPAAPISWTPAKTNQVLRPRERLRTGPNSRVALRWSDQSVVAFSASTELEILPPHSPGAQSGLHLIRGIVSFFHRDAPGRIRVITRGAVAGVEGTEFVLSVAEENNTEVATLSVVDGTVRFGNENGTLVLTNGQQAVAESGRAPVRTAGFIAANLLQWCFYYPAVLDLADLPLTPQAEANLRESLDDYRTGDLPGALAKYRTAAPAAESERIYYAALLLSVGQAAESEMALSRIADAPDASDQSRRLASALRLLIAAVKNQVVIAATEPRLPTELLAASYYEQSRAIREDSLARALELAKQAATNSPQSGFAWARVAELEFSFGHIRKASAALATAQTLSPRNAQALALRGFLLAAEDKPRAALGWFDRALALDPALGNAWLGRGLCRIRLGDAAGGRGDLLMAAALEPQRASLRSYLGKAYGDAGEYHPATREFHLAEKLDPNDPTPWLYSALLKQQYNHVNDAIRDLEQSQALNDNRSVYRSELLLDEDSAVRSANLASIYQDAGMTDVAIREASRAVNYDYANYSAHLFLANSYDALRDPNLVNLRYETPAENEYLLANLLAPVSAGPLSPAISQQEYSRLFAQNGVGVVSGTEYLSRGAWIQSGAQFGTFDTFNYSFDAYYRTDPGQRANNDVEQRNLGLSLKQQITPQDTVFFRAKLYKANGGDLAEYYDPAMASPTFRFNEKQEPILGLGYHHEWSPGVHTLVFAARVADNTSFTNQTQPTLVMFRPDDPFNPGKTMLTGVQGITMQEHFKNELEIYSTEVQQIWQLSQRTIILGGRFQSGDFNTDNLQNLPSTAGFLFPDPPEPAALQNINTDYNRFTVYGYHQWELTDWVELIGGVAYDHINYPENIRSAPISSEQSNVDDILPKAGLILRPAPGSVVRFAYTRSLAGASLDQSYQIEPSQVAGFIQSYRSLIPEAVAGANVGAEFETYGLSLEQKFPTGTYLAVSGELLYSDVHRTVGAFDVLPDQLDYGIPSGTREHLDFKEQSLLATANQLVGREWAFGGSYRLSRAKLDDDYTDVPSGLPPFALVEFNPRQHTEALLNHARLFGIYNHPCGFFAEADANWYFQDNREDASDLPDDEFWQFNVFAGYRFPRRCAELAAGVLNLGDEDYHLNPLNLYNEMPHERTLVLRLLFNF